LLLKQSSVFNVHVYTQSTAVASNMAAVIEARDRYDFAMNQVTNTYDFPVLFLLYCRDASSGCCHRDSSITCINHSVIKHSTFISCRRHVLCVAFRETIFLAVFLSFCVFPSVSLIIWKPTWGNVRLSLLRISWNPWHHMARYAAFMILFSRVVLSQIEYVEFSA